jgi:hypothetical protein
MQLRPFLKLAIPLGTLGALALAYGIQRLTQKTDPEIPLVPPEATVFPKLEPPRHGHKLAGLVTKLAGDKLDGTLVWLRSGDEGSFAYTDAQGAFRFDELGEGPWPAKVVALGYEPLEIVLQDTGAAQTIALTKSYGPPPDLAALERLPLAGHIAVSESFDASHFEVVLLPDHPERIDSALPRRCECDAKGAFHIDDLMVAHYTLRVLPAWARGGSWPDLLAGVGTSGAHEFTHAKGAGDLVLQLALGTIEGTLSEEIRLGPDGQPLRAPHDVAVEGALIELSAEGGRAWPPQASDAAGKFVFHALPPGNYELTARAGAQTLPQKIALGANEERKLELRLLLAPAK